jgi:hypothetical protein
VSRKHDQKKRASSLSLQSASSPSLQSSDARNKLVELLEELPIEGGAFADFSAELRHDLVDLHADWIIRSTEVGEYREWRETKVSGDVKAQKSVQRFAKLVEQLIECINSLPSNAVKAIISETGALDLQAALVMVAEKSSQSSSQSLAPHPYILRIALQKFLPGVIRASQRDLTPSQGGRRVKRLARETAEAAAKTYEFITGKVATPYRDRITSEPMNFERFLGDVYRALGITASAEDQAKALRREKTTKTKS